jgi:hypothetical protein
MSLVGSVSPVTGLHSVGTSACFCAFLLSLTIEASHRLLVSCKAIPCLYRVDSGEGLVTSLF